MATNCTSILKSLAWCQGTPELPGIKRRIYYIGKDQIVKWPTLAHDNRGRLTAAAYVGNFVLAADATWKFIDILPDKSQLTSEAQGEYPSMTQLNKLTAVHPGVGVDASALAAYVNNNDCVYLVETVPGKFRVVGSEAWLVKSTVAQDLGQGPTGTTSTTLSVEATDECPAPFYYGKIETEDGTIQPEQDSLVNYGDGSIFYGGRGYTTDNLSELFNQLATDLNIPEREIEKRYSIINQLYEGNPQLIAQKFSEDILLMLNQEVTALANADANP